CLSYLGIILHNPRLAPPVDNPSRHPLRYDHFLKSKGISAEDFPRLIFLCPTALLCDFLHLPNQSRLR
ncbi:unnamed protein product, partial [Brassica oleracea var. botrytis]